MLVRAPSRYLRIHWISWQIFWIKMHQKKCCTHCARTHTFSGNHWLERTSWARDTMSFGMCCSWCRRLVDLFPNRTSFDEYYSFRFSLRHSVRRSNTKETAFSDVGRECHSVFCDAICWFCWPLAGGASRWTKKKRIRKWMPPSASDHTFIPIPNKERIVHGRSVSLNFCKDHFNVDRREYLNIFCWKIVNSKMETKRLNLWTRHPLIRAANAASIASERNVLERNVPIIILWISLFSSNLINRNLFHRTKHTFRFALLCSLLPASIVQSGTMAIFYFVSSLFSTIDMNEWVPALGRCMRIAYLMYT